MLTPRIPRVLDLTRVFQMVLGACGDAPKGFWLTVLSG